MSKDAKLLRFYSILAGLIFLTALLAPFILTQDPYESSMQQAFLPPSAEHWFGTDKLGRDLFTRVIYGARISVFMSLTVVILIAGIGSAIGVVAGYVGGKVDTIIMRLADMFLAFPGIVLAIAIAGMMGGSVVNGILALVAVGWTKYARLARSMTLKVRQQDYIAAAVTNGTRPVQMFFRHIAPNILEIAGLSFLGFGAQPPTPEWGLMLNEGRQALQTAPWLMLFPGAAIVLVVAVFNLWGDALRDWLDPNKAS